MIRITDNNVLNSILVRIPTNDNEKKFNASNYIGYLYEITEKGANYFTTKRLFDNFIKSEYFNYEGFNKNFNFFTEFSIGDVVFDVEENLFGRVLSSNLKELKAEVINEKGITNSYPFTYLRKVFDENIIEDMKTKIIIKDEATAPSNSVEFWNANPIPTEIKSSLSENNIKPSILETEEKQQSKNDLNLNQNISTFLKKMIKENGIEICSNLTEVEKLLKSNIPDCKRELHLITISCKENIPQALYQNGQTLACEKFNELSESLCNNFFISMEASKWIIDIWTTVINSVHNNNKQIKAIKDNDGEYIGQIDEDGTYNGYGKFTWSNGNTYIGEWFDGVQYGTGILEYKNGTKYIGEFKNGLFNGNGVLFHTDGFQQAGSWKNNEFIA